MHSLNNKLRKTNVPLGKNEWIKYHKIKKSVMRGQKKVKKNKLLEEKGKLS